MRKARGCHFKGFKVNGMVKAKGCHFKVVISSRNVISVF